MDWERAAMRPGPRILSDHVSRDLCPDIERENMVWFRVAGQSASDVAALDDYTYPFAVGGVNIHIFPTSAIRDMLMIHNPKQTFDEKQRVAAFLATKLDNVGNPIGKGEDTTLQKFVRLFRPFIIVTSKQENSQAAMVGCIGNTVTGHFAGSNLSESCFPPGATVQTQLRMPCGQVSCMPGCHGKTCGIFAVFDTDYSLSARVTEWSQYGQNRARYVVAPTHDAEVVHSYERKQELQGSIKSETDHYTYEIAIRRIASIPTYCDTSLVRTDPDTIAVSEYYVDFSPCWLYRRYMVCLDENE